MDLYRHIFEFSPDGLLVVQEDGRIERANGRACALFGYAEGELDGQAIEVLIPERFTPHHAGYRLNYFKAPHSRPMGAGLELSGRRKDGSEFPVDIMLSPLGTDAQAAALCAIRDVTDRKRAEQLVLDSLKEKEVLLKEIHHRVKNNLAVISSLFYLQSNYLHDERMKAIMQQSQDRVHSMAMVHESLYSHDNLAEVDFAEYVASLGARLVASYGMDDRQIRLTTQLDPVHLGIDTAVPCGLVLNELITNAMKHGFPQAGRGAVHLWLRHTAPGWLELGVRDDGVGLPPRFDMAAGSSLGMRLIRSLVKQINGQVTYQPADPGTEVRIALPLRQRKED